MKYLYEPKPGVKKRCPVGLCAQFTALFFVLTMVSFTFSDTAQAQFHGVAIAKSCVQNTRTCTDDASCTDGDECTPDTCDQTIPNTTSCTIRITNDDDFGDTLSVVGGFDVEDFGGDNVRVPASGSLPISAVTGNTTCAVGAFVACTIGPDLGGGAGRVTFLSNTYVVQANDPDPLPDQATVTVADLCNGSFDLGCNTANNPQTFSGQTNLVSGCSSGAPIDCDDGNACTADSCDTATGDCVYGAPTVCDDENACTADSCDTATGDCVYGAPTVCDDGNACTADSCDTATGDCVYGAPTVCDDENACTADSCDTSTGDCVYGEPTVCDDLDECTDDSCDPLTGDCVYEDNGTCFADICRTPGFWKTHAGDEKGDKSFNISQEVIDSTDEGELSVCGTYIDNTNVGNSHSVLEAMCISVAGVQKRQLVRQLTAAALNCAVTLDGGDGSCTGVDSIEELYAECNEACRTNDSAAYSGCISLIDDWNNGRTGNLCHDRDLCPDFSDDAVINDSAACYEPTGAAGSLTACKAAEKNNVYVP